MVPGNFQSAVSLLYAYLPIFSFYANSKNMLSIVHKFKSKLESTNMYVLLFNRLYFNNKTTTTTTTMDMTYL